MPSGVGLVDVGSVAWSAREGARAVARSVGAGWWRVAGRWSVLVGRPPWADGTADAPIFTLCNLGRGALEIGHLGFPRKAGGFSTLEGGVFHVVFHVRFPRSGGFSTFSTLTEACV